MPIQPGLALQLKGAELPDPMAQFAQATQIQNALQQQRMGEMQIQNAMREQQRKQRFESTVAGFQPGMGIDERVRALQQQGLTNEAMQFAKTERELEKQRLDAETAHLTKIKTVAELTGRFLTGVKDDPSTYPAVRQQIISRGLATADELPEQFDPAFVDRVLKGSLSVKDQADIDLQTRRAAATEMSAGAAASQAETARAKLPFDEIRAKAAERAATAAEARAGLEKTPADIRTFQAVQAMTPEQQKAFEAYQAGKRPTTTVNIDQQGERAEATARGRGYVEHETAVRNAATAARKSLVSIESAQDVLAKGFDTGFATETKAKGAAVLAALGIKDAETYATDAQKFLQATMNQVLATQTEQKGVQTDQDALRIKQATAQMGNTKAANEFILDVARAQAERAIAQDKFYRDWLRDPDNKKSLAGAEDAWLEGEGSKSIFTSPRLKKYGVLASEQPSTPPPAGPIVGGRSATPRGRPSITERPQTPSAGDVVDGYRFKGGNPANENNWEKVGG